MEIKQAQISDIADISNLYQQLFKAMHDYQPEYILAAEQDFSFIQKMIENENSDVLLAKEKDETVGFALVRVQNTPPFPFFVAHRYADLMDLVVDETQRGRGVGTLLLEAVKKWAQAKNCDYVELGVLTQNEKAHRLYEITGFEECMKTMRLPL